MPGGGQFTVFVWESFLGHGPPLRFPKECYPINVDDCGNWILLNKNLRDKEFIFFKNLRSCEELVVREGSVLLKEITTCYSEKKIDSFKTHPLQANKQ